jgi:hypothetical protein
MVLFEYESKRVERNGFAESIGKLLDIGVDLNVQSNLQNRAS